MRRWRENPLSTTIAWALVLVFIVVASRTMFNTKVPNVGEFLPLPASPAIGGPTSHRRGTPAASAPRSPTRPGGACCLSPACCGCSTRASDSRCSSSGSWCSASGARGASRPSSPRTGPASSPSSSTLTLPLVPGVMSTGRLSALVAYAAVPWFVHLLRVAVGIGTADPAAADTDLVDGVLAPSRPRPCSAHGDADHRGGPGRRPRPGRAAGAGRRHRRARR